MAISHLLIQEKREGPVLLDSYRTTTPASLGSGALLAWALEDVQWHLRPLPTRRSLPVQPLVTPEDSTTCEAPPGTPAGGTGFREELADSLFGAVHAVPGAQLGRGVKESHLSF